MGAVTSEPVRLWGRAAAKVASLKANFTNGEARLPYFYLLHRANIAQRGKYPLCVCASRIALPMRLGPLSLPAGGRSSSRYLADSPAAQSPWPAG